MTTYAPKHRATTPAPARDPLAELLAPYRGAAVARPTRTATPLSDRLRARRSTTPTK